MDLRHLLLICVILVLVTSLCPSNGQVGGATTADKIKTKAEEALEKARNMAKTFKLKF